MRIQGREDSWITWYPKGIFSICWTGTTGEMQEKIAPAVRILDKYSHPYDIVYTNAVGTIVYEDDWQIAVRVEDGKMV